MKTQMVVGKHGTFIYYDDDMYIGASLRAYGEFSDEEFELWKTFLREGDVVVDVGANIGAMTVPLAQLVGPGNCHSFEPHPELFPILASNIIDNGLDVVMHETALADTAGMVRMPALREFSIPNYGGGSLSRAGAHLVSARTLDSYGLKGVKLIKIDVEGYESQVLLGARNTIMRDQPILYIENDRPNKELKLLQTLRDLGYKWSAHHPPMYNPNNYFKNPDNLFPGIVSKNLLCEAL